MIKIKINSKLKEGKEAPNLDYGVYIADSSDGFALYILDLDGLRKQVEVFKEIDGTQEKVNPEELFQFIQEEELEDYTNPSLLGFIEAENKNNEEDPCLKALNISFTAVHETRSGQGIGKLMYLLAMAHAAKKGSPVMPDRTHVEPGAINIWNSLSNDASIIKTFNKFGKPIAGGGESKSTISYFDVEDPRKTPIKIDDCAPANDEPYGVPLNRAYYSDKMYPQLQSYINNFKAFASQNFSTMSGLEDNLYFAAHSIFKRRFTS